MSSLVDGLIKGTVALSLFATWVCPLPAQGQMGQDGWYLPPGAPSTEEPTREGSGESTVELTFHYRDPADTEVWLLSPRVHGFWDVNDDAGIGFDATFLWASVTDETSFNQSLIQIGNVVLHARLHHKIGRLRLRYEPGVALPTAWIPDDMPSRAPIHNFAYHLAAAARGFMALWRFRTERIGILSRVWARLEGSPLVRAVALIGGGVSFALSERADTVEADIESQMGIEAGSEESFLGLAVRAAFFPTWESDDRAQVSVLAYGRVGLGRAFITGGVSVNVDDPHGVFAGSSRGYGVTLGLGTLL